MTVNDRKKLPKWAADEISRLENNVEYWKKLAHSATGEAPTNTMLVEGMDKLGLPVDSLVRFGVVGGTIDATAAKLPLAEGGGLILTASGEVAVCPLASNRIRVEIRGRR